jgi:hypothetical protein
MGGSKRAQGITKHEVFIQVNPIRLVDYAIVCAKAMVTKATSYDVLIGGGNSVPFRSHPRFLGGKCLLSTKMANKR